MTKITLDEYGRPAVKNPEKKSLKERAILHMCLWDWICSKESRENGYTLATLKVGQSITDAIELMGELPGNYVYIQGASEETGREVYGFICTDRPKALPDWDSCFFVGVYKDEFEEYKAVTSLYQLSDFLPNGNYRLGAIIMAGKGNTEAVSLESFVNALQKHQLDGNANDWKQRVSGTNSL